MSEFIANRIEARIFHNGEVTDLIEYDVKVKITKPRNGGHHNKIFNCLGYTLRHMTPRGKIDTTDDLLDVFKHTQGMYKILGVRDGEIIRKYHSISFMAMDQTEFEPVAERILDFCCVVLNDRPQEVINELIKLT